MFCVWNWRRSTCRQFRKIVQFGRIGDEMRTPLEIFCSIGRRGQLSEDDRKNRRKNRNREELLRNHESVTLIHDLRCCHATSSCFTRERRWASETSRPFSLRHVRVYWRGKTKTTSKRNASSEKSSRENALFLLHLFASRKMLLHLSCQTKINCSL